MIVRISGLGQFDLDDDGVKKLDELDTALTNAYHKKDATQFASCLAQTISFVCETGTPVRDDVVLPSDVIIPPDDTTLEDAHAFMTDEGLMAPLPA